MLEKIQDRFSESIQTQIAAAELLPKSLNEAAERVVKCLLNGGKVIVCGHGRSYANAQLLVSHLLHRYELARPTLAAHLLVFDGVLAGQLLFDNEPSQLYRKQLHAVAKAGDLVVVFAPIGNEEPVLGLIHAARNENLPIIALTSRRNDHTSGLLGEDDLEIAIPSGSEARILEGHQFCVNLLCELVDALLFPQTG